MIHSYHLESLYCGKWTRLKTDGLHFPRGYLCAKQDSSPRLAYRITRGDGGIVEEICARDDVSVGMVAGWPTAEQYERAADRALAMAKAIREREQGLRE